jgi:hypothetical protein
VRGRWDSESTHRGSAREVEVAVEHVPRSGFLSQALNAADLVIAVENGTPRTALRANLFRVDQGRSPQPLATFASGALVPGGARIRMFEPEFVCRVGTHSPSGAQTNSSEG